MKNLEDIILTLIVIIMAFMISNLSKRVKKLEDKIQ
jgi:predicted Holliday junction resolvase-like endonuclease